MIHLSDRMEEVVRLVGRRQLSYPKVADELGIHLSTVKVYVRRICERAETDEAPRALLTRLYWTQLHERGD